MTDQEILEEACLTLEQLCSAAELERDWLIRHVEEGLIPVSGTVITEWRFTTTHLARAKRMRELERTYDAAPELAALVDRKSTRLNSSHIQKSRMPSSA